MIKGNLLSLELLFTTLLDNAVKYSPQNSTIELNLSVRSKKATINIINQGQFIDNQDLAYVFEPFYRLRKVVNNNSNDRRFPFIITFIGLYIIVLF